MTACKISTPQDIAKWLISQKTCGHKIDDQTRHGFYSIEYHTEQVQVDGEEPYNIDIIDNVTISPLPNTLTDSLDGCLAQINSISNMADAKVVLADIVKSIYIIRKLMI